MKSKTRLNMSENQTTKDVSSRQVGWLFLGGLLLSLAWIVILYYIWGPSTGYLHSDSTDTILWAQESLEAGRTFNPDFHYAALLPFGANLWFVPLLAIFGYGLTAQLLGMSVFLVVLSAALIFLFRSLAWAWGESLGATGLALLLVSGSDKLRELFWGHTIYYSLGLVLFAVGVGLILRCFRADARQKKWALLLLLFSAGAATNGTQILALYFVPLFGALLLEAFLPAKAAARRSLTVKNQFPALLVFVGTIAGLLILLFLRRGGIMAGYAEAYTSWELSTKWQESFNKIVPDYLNLFGVTNKESLHLFSPSSLLLAGSLATAFLVLFLPLLMLIRYRHIKSPGTRFLLLAHTVQCALLLFLYIFSKLSAANWRLTPLLASSVVTSLVILRDWLQDKHLRGEEAALANNDTPTETPVRYEPSQASRWAWILLVIFAVGVLRNAVTILSIPATYGEGQQKALDTNYMEENDLRFGYGNFWRSQIYTLLTDEETIVRPIEVDEQGLYLRDYQNKDAWYEKAPTLDQYFLILSKDELTKLQESPDWQPLQLRIVKEELVGEHYFVILDENITDLLLN